MAMKKILILTADAGFGHRSAANAIAAALDEKYAGQIEYQIVNPMDDRRTPVLLRDSQSDYDKIIRAAPELWRIGYDASDLTIPSAIVESGLTVLMYDVMRDILRETSPDAIVTTYPLYQTPLSAVFTINRYSVPLYTVITDLITVHRLWFHPLVEGCLAPTQEVYDLAVRNGVAPEKIRITGLPVSPRLGRRMKSKAELRAEMGWDVNLPTILAVGSRRVEGMLDALNVVNHCGEKLQLVVVAGKDAEMVAQLRQVEWHIPVHLYEYTDNMPDFMQASDLIICKAGGLVVTESLAAGLPMLLINVLPGQETGNAQFVVDNGAGALTDTPIKLLEALRHLWLNDFQLLRQWSDQAAKVGKPNAAADIADILFQAAQRDINENDDRRSALRPRLMELLTRNQIRWQEDHLPIRLRRS